MWDELNLWIERYSGVEYDLPYYLRLLKNDEIFLSPSNWKNSLGIALDRLSDVIDVIDEHYQDLPDEFPSRSELKKMVTSNVLQEIIEILNDVKQKLNIEPTIIRTFKTLEQHVDGLCDLIQALSEHTMEWLIKHDWFDEYEDMNNDFLTDTFGIVKNDLSNMQFTINDIIQLHDED